VVFRRGQVQRRSLAVPVVTRAMGHEGASEPAAAPDGPGEQHHSEEAVQARLVAHLIGIQP
jgi:hypothetical protein